jgi:hypothetical protein
LRSIGQQVRGFEEGSRASAYGKTVDDIAKTRVHLLFMSLPHASHAVVAMSVKILLAKRTRHTIIKNLNSQPHRKNIAECSVGKQGILVMGWGGPKPGVSRWGRIGS